MKKIYKQNLFNNNQKPHQEMSSLFRKKNWSEGEVYVLKLHFGQKSPIVFVFSLSPQ